LTRPAKVTLVAYTGAMAPKVKAEFDLKLHLETPPESALFAQC
jgi:hypothetical protein